MNATLLILAVAVVLIAQAATVYVVRRTVRRWCTNVYEAGFKAGGEATRYGRDVGIEDAMSAVCDTLRDRGWHAQEIEAILDDAIDVLVDVAKTDN